MLYVLNIRIRIFAASAPTSYIKTNDFYYFRSSHIFQWEADISILLQAHILIMKYSSSIDFPKCQYEASKFETLSSMHHVSDVSWLMQYLFIGCLLHGKVLMLFNTATFSVQWVSSFFSAFSSGSPFSPLGCFPQ